MNKIAIPDAVDEAFSNVTLAAKQAQALVAALIAGELCDGKNGAEVATVISVIAEKQEETLRHADKLWIALTEAQS